MQSCQVCGRSFDPLRFQVVVPELGRGFDRIDCARSARTTASPSRRFAAVPLVAHAAPAAATASVAGVRRHATGYRLLGSTAATLGLLAAGTAAAALLWVRVVGTDTSSYTLGRLTAPPAFGHDRVQAQVEAAPTPTGPGEVTTVTVERVVTVPAPTSGVSGLEPTEPPPPRTSPPDRVSRPPTPASRPARETGKGHAKIGKGHSKHGEDDGLHSPGHGKGSPPEGKSKAVGGRSHGHGHSQGMGKHKH
jgi:hypothetical protein